METYPEHVCPTCKQRVPLHRRAAMMTASDAILLTNRSGEPSPFESIQAHLQRAKLPVPSGAAYGYKNGLLMSLSYTRSLDERERNWIYHDLHIYFKDNPEVGIGEWTNEYGRWEIPVQWRVRG